MSRASELLNKLNDSMDFNKIEDMDKSPDQEVFVRTKDGILQGYTVSYVRAVPGYREPGFEIYFPSLGDTGVWILRDIEFSGVKKKGIVAKLMKKKG